MHERRRRWRNGGIFNIMKNINKIYLDFLYFGNSLRSIKRVWELFLKQRKLLRWFGVHSIRVFSQFLWDPYYDIAVILTLTKIYLYIYTHKPALHLVIRGFAGLPYTYLEKYLQACETNLGLCKTCAFDCIFYDMPAPSL